MLIARRLSRRLQSFLAMLMGEETLEGVTEELYLELRKAYIPRAKRANVALLEMTIEPPLPILLDETIDYETEVKAILASLRSSEISTWIKGERKLRVLLQVATGASVETVQLAVVRRIRLVFDHHLGPFPIYPSISFIVLTPIEEINLRLMIRHAP